MTRSCPSEKDLASRVRTTTRTSTEPRPFFIAAALGGNTGNPRESFNKALDLLGEEMRSILVSSLYATEPSDVLGQQNDFLNAAFTGETLLAPHEVLERFKDCERLAGRTKSLMSSRLARPLDIDLLLYEDRIITSQALTVPHPRMRLRRFVLAPLAELAGERLIPGCPGLTVSRALSLSPAMRIARIEGPLWREASHGLV